MNTIRLLLIPKKPYFYRAITLYIQHIQRWWRERELFKIAGIGKTSKIIELRRK